MFCHEKKRRKLNNTELIQGFFYSFPCNPLILETEGKGSHLYCFHVVVGFFLFPLLSSPHGSNKVVLSPSCTWIRCTRASSWYSNGPFNSDLVETFKTNAFNAFILDRVIGPFGIFNGSSLVFLGWSTSTTLKTK